MCAFERKIGKKALKKWQVLTKFLKFLHVFMAFSANSSVHNFPSENLPAQKKNILEGLIIIHNYKLSHLVSLCQHVAGPSGGVMRSCSMAVVM